MYPPKNGFQFSVFSCDDIAMMAGPNQAAPISSDGKAVFPAFIITDPYFWSNYFKIKWPFIRFETQTDQSFSGWSHPAISLESFAHDKIQ